LATHRTKAQAPG